MITLRLVMILILYEDADVGQKFQLGRNGFEIYCRAPATEVSNRHECLWLTGLYQLTHHRLTTCQSPGQCRVSLPSVCACRLTGSRCSLTARKYRVTYPACSKSKFKVWNTVPMTCIPCSQRHGVERSWVESLPFGDQLDYPLEDVICWAWQLVPVIPSPGSLC